MKQYVLYTTSKSNWIKKQVAIFARAISQTKGRGEVSVTVKTFKPPFSIPLSIDSDKDIKPSWNWFREIFKKGDYDGVIVHFSTLYRDRWGIKSGSQGKRINGSRNQDNKLYPEFWVADDLQKEPAPGYEKETVDGEVITDLLRKLFHEHGHFDEDLDDEVGNVLTQTSVHIMDYDLKQIHKYHLLIDYRGKSIKEQVDKLIIIITKFVKQLI